MVFLFMALFLQEINFVLIKHFINNLNTNRSDCRVPVTVFWITSVNSKFWGIVTWSCLAYFLFVSALLNSDNMLANSGSHEIKLLFKH